MTDKRIRIGWLVLLPLMFIYFMLRNSGLAPSVLSDEWSYSSAARLMPLSAAPLPSYLYLAVFGATNACGNAFLDCARGLNSILFLAAAPLLYAVARRVAAPLPACAVALLSVLGPLNAYTAYFMPEASYFFAFWLLTWCVLRFHDRPDAARAAGVGAALGALSLIKVHALFLLPAICLCMLAAGHAAAPPAGHARRLLRAVPPVLLMLAVAAALRFGIGYLAAGVDGLSLSGRLYAGQSDYANAHRKPWPLLLQMAYTNLRGHAMALALLAGLPAAALLAHGASPAARRATPAAAPLALYTALTLLTLLAVTALFTASVAGTGPSENVARLHMRYYNFALPLLSIYALGQLAGAAPDWRARLAGALPLAALLVLGLLGLKAEFVPSYVDSPELLGMSAAPSVFRTLGVLGLLALALWAWRPRLGAGLFLWLFLPLLTLAAASRVNADVRAAGHADLYAQAGRYARAQLAPAELAQLVIIGPDDAGLFKAKFELDDLGPLLLPTPAGAPVAIDTLPAQGWLLEIGDYAAPPYAVLRTRGAGYSLWRLAPPRQAQRLDLRAASLAPVLRSSSGLGEAEPWGRWSEGPLVTLNFATPLPPHLILRLSGHAFGPNAGRDVVVRVGAASGVVRLTAQQQKLALALANAGGETTITLQVPQAVSPLALGLGNDGRQL